MSHRIISAVFLVAFVTAVVVFSLRPPRAQAHLAAVDDAIQQALHGQRISRVFFGPVTDTEGYVWCRYFVSPRMLLDSEAHAGDTVLSLFPTGFSISFDTTLDALLADVQVDSVRAILYIAH